MLLSLILSFVLASMVTGSLIVSGHRHAHWSADHDLSGPQKMHAVAVPRVGGIGIAVGWYAGLLGLFLHNRSLVWPLVYFLACSAPCFAFGLQEDFTKAVSPRRRLVGAALSGVLGIFFLNAVIVRTAIPGLDALVQGSFVFAACLTVLLVAGVVHAVNIIDGMNGLASMSVAMMLLALGWIGHQVGDELVFGVAMAAAGGVLGFFVWNFPRGLVFLGDGGAYLLGFLVIELGLVLLQRNPQVSPFAPLAIIIYPVFETVFTMYRRKMLKGKAVGLPDGIHLHTLLYRRVLRQAFGAAGGTAELARRNSMTSPYLWGLNLLAVLPAAVFWNSSPALLSAMAVFGLAYLALYWSIVRFCFPVWLAPRSRRG